MQHNRHAASTILSRPSFQNPCNRTLFWVQVRKQYFISICSILSIFQKKISFQSLWYLDSIFNMKSVSIVCSIIHHTFTATLLPFYPILLISSQQATIVSLARRISTNTEQHRVLNNGTVERFHVLLSRGTWHNLECGNSTGSF